MSRVLVLDSGGGSVKAGFAGDEAPVCVVPNTVARIRRQIDVLVADETEAGVQDTSQLVYARAADRGFIVNWEVEQSVWARVLEKHLRVRSPKEHGLVVTEPLLHPPALSQALDEAVFETFGFDSFVRTPAPRLAMLHYLSVHSDSFEAATQSLTVVDTGFSFTHIVPFYAGCMLSSAVRRVNVGGKMLTNLLKEQVSFRQWNLMEHTSLLNRVKEQVCYVAQDFPAELAACRRSKDHTIEFVLPDFESNPRGYVRGGADDPTAHGGERPEGGAESGAEDAPSGDEAPQVLTLNNERICVPEVLFHPSDIGLSQMGIVDAYVDAVSSCSEEAQIPLFSSALLVGGNAMMLGFASRFEAELRSAMPAELPLRVLTPDDPMTAAWRGGSLFGSSSSYAFERVTRAEYEEKGHAVCVAKFGGVPLTSL